MKKQKCVLTVMFILSFIGIKPVSAQYHLYNRVEFGAGNVWTYVGEVAASMVINQLTGSPLTEATLRFGVPISEYGNMYSFQGFEDWNYDRFRDVETTEYDGKGYAGFGTDELFSNIIVGDKVGYMSDRLSFLNYCIYASGYYNLQKFKIMQTLEEYTPLTTQRMQLGGGLMLMLGSVESTSRFIFDAGLRYNIPIAASLSGYNGKTSDLLNSGISSHYMFKWSWDNGTAVGATLDLMHYNLLKDEGLVGETSKIAEFGITLTLLIDKLLW